MTGVEWVACGLSSVMALIAVAFGYGRLVGRMKAIEHDVEELRRWRVGLNGSVGKIEVAVARMMTMMEEREGRDRANA